MRFMQTVACFTALSKQQSEAFEVPFRVYFRVYVSSIAENYLKN
jgi:hypothetical protein